MSFKVTAVVVLSFIVRCQFFMIYIVVRKIQNIFLFLLFLSFFEGTALFPWFLCIFSTWLDSLETFDCTPLYLCIHSCASRCFIVTCWWCLSPEILYWNIQHPLKTCFIGGLLDHCKRKISGSSSLICHCILNQTIQPYFNIVTMTSLITHVVFSSYMLVLWWSHTLAPLKVLEKSHHNFIHSFSAVA